MYDRSAPIVSRGGAGIPAYQLITGWGSIDDAGAFTTAGTGHNAGTLTWQMAGDILQIDGIQENWAGWSLPLTTLYGDWSDTTDRLELILEVVSMPLTLAKYGLMAGVFDTTYAGRAAAIAQAIAVYPNATTVINAGQVGATATSAAAAGSNTNVVTQAWMSITWDSGGVGRIVSTLKRTSDQNTVTITGSPLGAMAAASSRRVFVGHQHESTTTGTPAMSAKLWHRRIRATTFL